MPRVHTHIWECTHMCHATGELNGECECTGDTNESQIFSVCVFMRCGVKVMHADVCNFLRVVRGQQTNTITLFIVLKGL